MKRFFSDKANLARIAFLIILISITGFIWQRVYRLEHGRLTVAVLDVGQGDSIYIEAPNGNQVIFDGGPDGKILSELGKVMPFNDRSIDMLVVTNPDKDHYAGFLDVLDNFTVSAVLEPSTYSKTKTYAELERMIVEKKVPNILAKRGMKIWLDKKSGVYISILFPDRDVSTWKPNEGSIVAKLVYGQTSMLLTGDSTALTEHIIVSLEGDNLKSTVLKVGHHGSRTSSSPEFVSYVLPLYAIISDGKDNSYGHPHKETLDTLKSFGAKVYRTDLFGTIIMKSDGKSFTVN
ncbi:MAG: MBL fold metallo-hydrolase [Candidatus Paceibacterota bacterium]